MESNCGQEVICSVKQKRRPCKKKDVVPKNAEYAPAIITLVSLPRKKMDSQKNAVVKCSEK